jgi:hypothetical protein
VSPKWIEPAGPQNEDREEESSRAPDLFVPAMGGRRNESSLPGMVRLAAVSSILSRCMVLDDEEVLVGQLGL